MPINRPTTSKSTTKSKKEDAAKKQKVKPAVTQNTVAPIQMSEVPAIALQRAVADPGTAHPSEILALQHKYGNQAVQHLLSSNRIQAKLTVGAASDVYEQEADRIAAQVVRGPILPAPIITRADKKQQIQNKTIGHQTDGSFSAASALESRLNARKGSGQPLGSNTRAFMESQLGADFSNVRVHTDGEATALSQSIQAQAFTHEQDIYFGEGRYQPESESGKHLLAHELTHSVQQGAAPLKRQAGSKRLASTESMLGKIRPAQSKPHGNVVQRMPTWDQVKNFGKKSGSLAGGIALGPVWDAGKAVNRKKKGGNLFFGGKGYRRYVSKDTRAGKDAEFRTGAQMSEAYGGDVKGGIGRVVNILSIVAGDVAKYAGWGTGVLGALMLIPGAAIPLAPIVTVLGSITATAIAAKLGLTAFNQAYLANRIDTAPAGAGDNETRKEEQSARSDYGRAVVTAAAYAGGGLAAEAASGSNAHEAWLETTGQSKASSSAAEVGTGMATGVAAEVADVVHDNNSTPATAASQQFTGSEKPKNTVSTKKFMHLLNPVYLMVRMLTQIRNLSEAALNTFKKEGEHKKTKEGIGATSAKYKVGTDASGEEGMGHKGIRSIKNFFRSKKDQLNPDDTLNTSATAKEGLGRTGLKKVSQGLGGVVGGATGAVGGTIGGAAAGGYQGAKRLGQAGWEKGNELGGWKGKAAGGVLAFGGGIAGLVGGTVGGAGMGLVKGTEAGARGGWQAAKGASRAGEAVGGRVWDKGGELSDKMTDGLSKVSYVGKPAAAIAGLGMGVIRGGLALGLGATAAVGQVATAGIAAGVGATKATSESVNAKIAGDELPAHLQSADRTTPEAVPEGGYSLMKSFEQFVKRTQNYVKQGEDGLKDLEKR